MKTSRAKPKRTLFDYLSLILCTAVLGAFVAVLLMVAHDILDPTDLNQRGRYWCLLLGVAVAAIGISAFLYHHSDKYTWALTDDLLIRGKRNKNEFPLVMIDKLILGLPPRTHWSHGLLRKIVPREAYMLDVSFQTTLLIKLNNGAFIPLNIHACHGGSELMAQLLQKLSSKVDEHYHFSAEETKALLRPRWNDIMIVN